MVARHCCVIGRGLEERRHALTGRFEATTGVVALVEDDVRVSVGLRRECEALRREIAESIAALVLHQHTHPG